MTAQERAKVLEAYNDTRRFRDMEIVNEDPSAPFSHFDVIPGGGSAEHGSYGKKPGYFDHDQLYDLEKDPEESQNLANDPGYTEIITDMKQELKSYLDSLPGKFEL